MKQHKHSTGLVLTILCTFTLLIAACSTSELSSTSHSTSQRATKLNLLDTPAPTATMAPKETYVGEVSKEHAWIGLSSKNHHAVIFVTDGAKDHPVTFAQWFRGPITNDVIDLTAADKTGNDHLQAMVEKDTASGTVTLVGGKSFEFTAKVVPDSDKDAGLYRSDKIVNGEHYIAGWVLMPGSMSSPLPPESTPGMSSPSPSMENALPQGGAILNQKTYALLPVPELTSQEIEAQEVNLPKLGTFKPLHCGQHAC